MHGPVSKSVVDILIPARNCEEHLRKTLAAVPAPEVRSVVVVVYESKDATAQVAMDAGAVVLRSSVQGAGAAVRQGIAHFENLPRPPDVVVMVPANGAVEAQQTGALLRPIREDNAELVLGVRTSADLDVGDRLALKLIGALYQHRFSDISGFRAIRFAALVALGMRDPGTGWTAEMPVKALKLGLHIVEVAVRGHEDTDKAVRVSAPRRLARAAGASGRTLFQIIRHSTAR
jgi:glycosyltransferase involved in cell wall biosynthesis